MSCPGQNDGVGLAVGDINGRSTVALEFQVKVGEDKQAHEYERGSDSGR